MRERVPSDSHRKAFARVNFDTPNSRALLDLSWPAMLNHPSTPGETLDSALIRPISLTLMAYWFGQGCSSQTAGGAFS